MVNDEELTVCSINIINVALLIIVVGHGFLISNNISSVFLQMMYVFLEKSEFIHLFSILYLVVLLMILRCVSTECI